jgi:recombination protein RecR
MNSFDKLNEYFSKFPGIGQRQAKRFVYHLLSKDTKELNNFCENILKLKKETHICDSCYRIFTKKGSSTKCPICLDLTRDPSLLLIVATDTDLEVIEKSGSYRGFYFVLGGLSPILDKSPETKIRLKELHKCINERSRHGLSEVILALSANPEAENTAMLVRERIGSSETAGGFKISELGRGLSSGSEVEYSDKDTIKNAISRRQ